LAANPGLPLIAVIPRFPDQDGRLSLPPNIVGHNLALEMLHRSGGTRVRVYRIENLDGTPVYVHAKACIIDDVWASVGSDNFNRRYWTHDSELSCAVLDETLDLREPHTPGGRGQHARAYGRDLRLPLSREHLDRSTGGDADLCDPRSAFAAFAGPPPCSMPGAPKASTDNGRRDGCGPIRRRIGHGGPGPGQRRCTGACTIPTGVHPRCGAPTPLTHITRQGRRSKWRWPARCGAGSGQHRQQETSLAAAPSDALSARSRSR
jgi:hypothetical protein